MEKHRKGTRTSRTLVVQLADIGDLVLAAPAIVRLRESGNEVSLLTKPGNVELARQLSDDVIVADKHLYDSPISLVKPKALAGVVGLLKTLRRRRFDHLVLLHHLTTRFGALKFASLSIGAGAREKVGLDNGRGRFLTEKHRDHGFGAANEAEYWANLADGYAEFQLRTDDGAASRLLETRGVSGRFAVLHPGSGRYSVARRWPVEYFAAVATRLRDEHGLSIVVVGTADERELAVQLLETVGYGVNLTGDTNLASLVGLLERAAIFIGNNAGVAQIAGTLDIPSVIVFGPTSPKTWQAPNSRSRAIRLDIPCSPCLYHHSELGTPEGCATRECLWNLRPDMVMTQVRELLDSRVAA